MSLSVLLNVAAVPFQPKEPKASTAKYSDEYVRYLERVIAQLSTAFAHVVHHNPPEMISNQSPGHQPPLPDLVLSAKSPESAADLRARRGLSPLSCGVHSCASSLSVTPSVSPDLTTPSTSTFSFCEDVLSVTPTAADADDARDAWRQVGRDLRLIADSFAQTRAPPAQHVSTGQSWLTAVVAFVWSALMRRFL